MSFSYTNFVIGRDGKQGDIQDVTVSTTAEGINLIQIARDANDISPRIYVVDRRILPDGSISRLLEVNSFSDVEPDRLSEVRVEAEFEVFPNVWNIMPEQTFGLPAGMESPWFEPIEMIENELLLPIDAVYVSGDAPVNIDVGDSYKNGKYEIAILTDRIEVYDKQGKTIGTIYTDTSLTLWEEGVAGAASFRGGSIFVEPAKPPIFQGSFTLDRDPVFISPGLYEYGDNYLVSSVSINNRQGVGSIAFVKDVYPERWVAKLMGRAYTRLVSPANIPPLVEDEPSRISVQAFPTRNDFPDIEPRYVTAYANKEGIFNSWEIEENPVIYSPRERPYDVLLPFEGRREDWGGYSVWSPVDFYSALDVWGKESASFPTIIPSEMPEIPTMPEGTIHFNWKDSGEFRVISGDTMKLSYKKGYFYFENSVSPSANGIAKIIASDNWNATKVEWTSDTLFVNDIPALTEENPWSDYQGKNITWGKLANIPSSKWNRIRDSFPVSEETYEEDEEVYETGVEEDAEVLDRDYVFAPSTWGRVLFEQYEEDVNENLFAGTEDFSVYDINDEDI